ncbi:hypothetical protein J7438_00015 [Thalassotalea sp. G20_0]|uniref:hypothetical protein n=1 Tax=Thalassotalea sp. G20_0 TaxID=2821093 RepID=UPI001ADA3955|nr:hypothetical protein [Thalassotalea sp. G20_0]MBO9492484.1 hypothetical protein [Thalassotalea sp. G20_0]
MKSSGFDSHPVKINHQPEAGFADDFVMVFQNFDDCCRVERVLPKRLGGYGLTLHPEKTQRIDFRVQYRKESKRRGLPINFDFLGFTHFWGITRKGGFAIFRKTVKGRLAKTLKSFNDFCRKDRHKPLSEQYAMLNRKLRGHFAYFDITGNIKALKAVHDKVQKIWHKSSSSTRILECVQKEKPQLLVSKVLSLPR